MGVLGSMVVEELRGEGIEPVLYARHFDESLMTSESLAAIRYARGDVLDLPNLVHVMQRYGTTHVVHMAAVLRSQAQENPYLGFKINAEGTVNVLEAARITNVARVVYTSSKSIYGAIPPPYCHPTYEPLPEEGPKNPVLVYDVTKLAGEHMALNYSSDFDLDVLILRFASTYGPGKLARHGPVSWHSQILENAMAGRPAHLPQGGDQKDDMIYHRDIARAIVLACRVERPRHRVFNIGTGKASTMREFADAVRRIIPKADIDVGAGLDYYGSGIPYYSVYDIRRARDDLAFESRYDFEAGIRDYIATMKKLGAEPTVTAV
jgi:UDP-glucose 4-epimerase